jgi:vacuolar protein sorting-associated protein 35
MCFSSLAGIQPALQLFFSPEIQHPSTVQHLLSLLITPIQSYSSVLTVLALPSYEEVLGIQSYQSRRAISQAVIASILRNETIIDSPEDVKGILDICSVLIRDQKSNDPKPAQRANQVQHGTDEEMEDEQGWVARIIHLFKSEDLEVQFELLQVARKEFIQGGDRVRWTLPPLIVSGIRLARRYKYKEHYVSSLFDRLHLISTDTPWRLDE